MLLARGRTIGAASAAALLLTTLVATPSAADELFPAWTSSAGSGGNLRYFDAAATPDGGVVLAGWSEEAGDIDGIVRKLNANGGTVWTTRVGDDAAADYFAGVDVAADGTVFATGQTRGDVGGRQGGTDFDAMVAKISANGSFQWARQFGRNGVNEEDAGRAVAAAPDGSVFVGASYSSNAKPVVTRYDGAGNQQWIFEVGEDGDLIFDAAMLGSDAFFSGVRYAGGNPMEGFLWSQSLNGTFSSDTRMPGVTRMRVSTHPSLNNKLVAGGDGYLGTFGIFGLGEEQLNTGGRVVADVALQGDGSLLVLDGGATTLRGYDADGQLEGWARSLSGLAAGGRVVATNNGRAFTTTPTSGFSTNNLAGFTADESEPPPVETVAGFDDVPATAFFADAVVWLKDEGVVAGTTDTTFSPGQTVTRAQMAAFLHRLVGEPAGSPDGGFGDVPSGAFYADAVDWLVAQGVTTGTGDGTYSPQEPVTRAQMAAFLFRLAGEPAGSPAEGFSDVPDGAFYAPAVSWLVDQGITTGTTATTYGPNQRVTRAQMAAFLFRMATDSDWVRPV